MKHLYSILMLLLFLIPALVLAGEQQKHFSSFADVETAIRRLRNPNHEHPMSDGSPSEKCGLWITMEAAELRSSMTISEQQALDGLFSVPSTQTSKIIGRFEIHYDTTGDNAPAMLAMSGGELEHVPDSYEEYVDSTGKIFNDVWEYEINLLGYPEPPLDPTNLYHIYISDLGIGYYGYTQFENQISTAPIPRYQTYIVIDNDFRYVYSSSRGVPGIKVTAAHEFHHAIQLGGYGNRSADRYFYEITSTWMEDEVYNDVNDYIQYLSNSPARKSQFSTPDLGFTTVNGEIEYSRCVWGKYLAKRFTGDIIKDIWEEMPNYPSLQAMNIVLQTRSTSFREAFIEFAIWNSSTGFGAETDTIRYYTEGKQYPSMRIRSEVEYADVFRAIEDTLRPVSSGYYSVCSRRSPSDACGTGIQMRVIVTNVNMLYSEAKMPFRYIMNSSGDAGYKHLSNGMYVKLETADPANWSSYETDRPLVDEVIVYPNVVKADEHHQINFVLPSGVEDKAILYVFSSSMDKMTSKEISISYKRPLEPSLVWDGLDQNGNPLPSGVYIVVVEVDGNIYKGKFAVVR